MKLSLMIAVCFCVGVIAASDGTAAVTRDTDKGFTIVQSVDLPIDVYEAYDAMTGDISGWWDHKFTEKPTRFFIDAKPGGHFIEVFDESGDGAIHGTVVYAQRGKVLRYVGPLGFSGKALDLYISYTYEPNEGGCLVTVTVEGKGNVEEGWVAAIDGVWHHFLVEQLKPYVESGKHED